MRNFVSIVDDLKRCRHDIAELAFLFLSKLDVRVHELELQNVHATRQRSWQLLVVHQAVLALAAQLDLHKQVGAAPVRWNAAVDFLGERYVSEDGEPGPRLLALVFDKPGQFHRAACLHLHGVVNLLLDLAHLVLKLHF